jgi:hypothetical protein
MRRSSNEPPITLHGEIEAQTARAVLFRAHHWDEAQWLPKSQVEIDRDPDGGEVTIRVAGWLARKNGWDEHGEMDTVDLMRDGPIEDDF